MRKIKISKEQSVEFKSFFEASLECIDIVWLDMKKLLKLAESRPDDECWRRMVIRQALTYIDLMCYQMRTAAYMLSSFMKKKLTEEQERFLTGFKTVYRKGKPEKKRVSYIFLEKCKKSITVCAEVLELKLEDNEDLVWAKFENTINIRHRLTHPENTSDLSVSEVEYYDAAQACHGFYIIFSKLLDKLKTEIKLRPLKRPPDQDTSVLQSLIYRAKS